jgi:hypothetical protein
MSCYMSSKGPLRPRDHCVPEDAGEKGYGQPHGARGAYCYLTAIAPAWLLSLFDPFDIRPHRAQFAFDFFVAAVDVVDAVDAGFAAGYQAG